MKKPSTLLLIGALVGGGVIVGLWAPEWRSNSTEEPSSALDGLAPEAERTRNYQRTKPQHPRKSGPRSVDSVDVVELMKDGVRYGEIREHQAFRIEDVIEWSVSNWNEREGVRYDCIGKVVYTAETKLGTETLGARAYVRDGQIITWDWAMK